MDPKSIPVTISVKVNEIFSDMWTGCWCWGFDEGKIDKEENCSSSKFDFGFARFEKFKTDLNSNSENLKYGMKYANKQLKQ